MADMHSGLYLPHTSIAIYVRRKNEKTAANRLQAAEIKIIENATLKSLL